MFLHEHPAGATSWQEEMVVELMSAAGVDRVVADQCQYGQEVLVGQYLGCPIKKPTGFMRNAPEVLNSLRERCTGKLGRCSRRQGGEHATCSGKIAKDAQRYPLGLCKAIPKGIHKELQARGVMTVGDVGMHALEDEDLVHLARGPEQGYSGKYLDDISKQKLRDDLVEEAGRKELEYFVAKGVWQKCPRQKAFLTTGKPPISVRWVDVNKGDDVTPKYRSRLVARQLKAMDKSGESFFAPTPPLESLRAVLSLAASEIGGWKPNRDPKSANRTQISLVDISRAYFNAKVDDDSPTFVQLPPEDKDSGVLCAQLLRHMYGTRAAADGWQDEYSSTMVVELGFVQGGSSPCLFRHPSRTLVSTVHGDDFTTVGDKSDLDWFESELAKHYELTTQPRIGPGSDDAKEGIILNRVVRWTSEGLEYEADPRQAEKLIQECGLRDSNTMATPGLRASFEETENDTPLDKKLHTAFRGSAARANYLAADRVDCQFAAKEICRWMASPTAGSWSALKRLCRYLVGLPRLVYSFNWQVVDAIDVYTDTDWAGCPRTRKSTSGGCVLMGRHALKSWSTTQSSVALSSGEAEFNGVVRGSGIALGMQILLKDLGHELPVRVWTDSSAAIGVCTRQGLGKLRHLDTHTLWVQQAVRSGRIDLRKVLGEENPADIFTKHSLARDRLMKLTALFDCRFTGGRAAAAPQTRTSAAPRVTMAEAMTVDEAVAEPFMPHVSLSAADLDRLYPSVTVPEAVDAEDGNDLEDQTLNEGLRQVEELVQACAEQGRRRRLASSSERPPGA